MNSKREHDPNLPTVEATIHLPPKELEKRLRAVKKNIKRHEKQKVRFLQKECKWSKADAKKFAREQAKDDWQYVSRNADRLTSSTYTL